MNPLPFTLRVAGVDTFTFEAIASTAFTFTGLLRLEPEAVYLEWTGSAHVDEVAFTGVRSEQVSLPQEYVHLPYPLLRSAELRGGWIRPHLELGGWQLDTLQSIPGEEGGRLRLWLARRDRRLARQVHRTLRERMSGLPPDTRLAPPRVISTLTPPEGAV
jgi:hypothetical protein